MEPKLTLVIPIYNEAGNIGSLVENIKNARRAEAPCPTELILVNNGSTDDSHVEITQAALGHTWIRVIHEPKNLGYGGGIQKGLAAASSTSTHLGWMPADHQYCVEDLVRVWRQVYKKPAGFHKGMRVQRKDSLKSQWASKIYTTFVRMVLCLDVVDVNGLPKIFPASLFRDIRFNLASNFHLECQMMMAAQIRQVPIYEHPVKYFTRQVGASNWSDKRLSVYGETMRELFKVRVDSKEWYKETT